MAPEVALARPGAFVNIRYDKSDLWTAGTIAYEMFGQINPFYRDKDRLLNSRTYSQVRFACESEEGARIPMVHHHNVNMPLFVAAVVRRCMAKQEDAQLHM